MSGALVPVRPATADRDRIIAALSEAFASGALEMEELERRVTIAHTSEALAEIEALAGDLPPSAGVATSRALVVASAAPPRAVARAILGSVVRAGAWQVPRELEVSATFGSTELDFREARLPRGPIDVHVKTICGSVEIIVPPELAVEATGSAVLGSFEQVDRAPATPDPDAPVLRIHGTAVLGSVEIRMQVAGGRALKKP